MRRESKKRAAAMRVYRKRRDEFLTEHPRCQFPTGCEARATVVHHRRGRFGGRLLDERWWAAACDLHNDFAETHTGEALDLGWLVRIEGVA
jgi:hypothetical protein